MGENVHEGHRRRVRERFVKEGLDTFTEHQALEFLLFHCIQRHDTNVLAHRLLKAYGSLSNLFDANPMDIQKTCKVSFNTAVFLSLIPHISRMYAMSKWEGRICLGTSKEASQFCINLFTGKIYESFYVICLDMQNRLLSTTVLSEGTINETHVYPRLVVETALRFQASSIILTHNHPGGSLVPSFSDIEATNKIAEVLSMISITVVDHIIVSGENYYSFMENDYLPLDHSN